MYLFEIQNCIHNFILISKQFFTSNCIDLVHIQKYLGFHYEYVKYIFV